MPSGHPDYEPLKGQCLFDFYRAVESVLFGVNAPTITFNKANESAATRQPHKGSLITPSRINKIFLNINFYSIAFILVEIQELFDREANGASRKTASSQKTAGKVRPILNIQDFAHILTCL